jgi:hypothetical protein
MKVCVCERISDSFRLHLNKHHEFVLTHEIHSPVLV